MRTLLIITALLLVFSANMFAQRDFVTLDKQSYDYYLNGDYRNLKKTADTLFSQGIDYYYLRMRLGVLAYNNQLYFNALTHFSKALEFNSLDTVSMEYIYFSYLFSGRDADAKLYLKSIPSENRNSMLSSLVKRGSSVYFAGSTVSGSDVTLYETNSLYYESVKSSLGFYAGFESFLSDNVKGSLVYTNYRKTGTVYSGITPSGTDLDFTQNQVYANLTGYFLKGWGFSVFGQAAFYPDIFVQRPIGTIPLSYPTTAVYLGGAGLIKTGWKIRAGTNISFSNLSGSNQARGEAWVTYLPFANLNLYFTSGGMLQTDNIWGETYQINQELGFKVNKFIWFESGIVKGNSYLYARNEGYLLNNSFQIPLTTIYSNITFLAGDHFSIKISPFFNENAVYSWDMNTYTRTDKISVNSFGGTIKLTYKNK